MIVLGIVLWQVRRFPERTGAYLLGVSLVPAILLGLVMTRMPACGSGMSATGECYAPVTGPALIVYVVAGLVGFVLLVVTLRRMFDT